MEIKVIEKGFAFEEFVKTAQEKIDDLKKLEDSLKKDKLKWFKNLYKELNLLKDLNKWVIMKSIILNL